MALKAMFVSSTQDQNDQETEEKLCEFRCKFSSLLRLTNIELMQELRDEKQSYDHKIRFMMNMRKQNPVMFEHIPFYVSPDLVNAKIDQITRMCTGLGLGIDSCRTVSLSCEESYELSDE